MSTERRRNPRVEILGRLHGHVVALNIPITVLEMSLGGLALQTDAPFPVGATHEFSLMLGDGSSVVVKGKVMHSRNVSTEDGPDSYVTGIQFVDDDGPDGGETTIGDLLDRVK